MPLRPVHRSFSRKQSLTLTPGAFSIQETISCSMNMIRPATFLKGICRRMTLFLTARSVHFRKPEVSLNPQITISISQKKPAPRLWVVLAFWLRVTAIQFWGTLSAGHLHPVCRPEETIEFIRHFIPDLYRCQGTLGKDIGFATINLNSLAGFLYNAAFGFHGAFLFHFANRLYYIVFFVNKPIFVSIGYYRSSPAATLFFISHRISGHSTSYPGPCQAKRTLVLW